MHKPSLSQLVYNALYPKPRSNDPPTFGAHITRNLVPEVRIETSTFYGTLDCIEAQYPGLDYSYGPHRMRLGRFKHHRHLFRAFDELGLTPAEISSLCRWEGTKSARDRYERDEGVLVRDTTADEISSSPPRRPSIHVHREPNNGLQTVPEGEIDSRAPTVQKETREPEHDAQSEIEDEAEEDVSEEEIESYGVALNQRLLEATAARERGADVPLDEDWEQWLKEAVERGGYANMISAIRAGRPFEPGLTRASTSSPPAAPVTASPERPTGDTAIAETLLLSARSNILPTLVPSNAAFAPSSSNSTSTAR